MWRLFNNPIEFARYRFVIVDPDGLITEIDETYRDIGIDEGWLEYTGAIDKPGLVEYRYRFLEFPYLPVR